MLDCSVLRLASTARSLSWIRMKSRSFKVGEDLELYAVCSSSIVASTWEFTLSSPDENADICGERLATRRALDIDCTPRKTARHAMAMVAYCQGRLMSCLRTIAMTLPTRLRGSVADCHSVLRVLSSSSSVNSYALTTSLRISSLSGRSALTRRSVNQAAIRSVGAKTPLRLPRSSIKAAVENVALWHERDISHSSAERMIAPDATVTLDFALTRLAGLIEKLLILPRQHAEEPRPAGWSRAFAAAL